uniref:LysR family transcriptional regulator n=1 Tax=Thaumasiovibrio occultus TaxID=1891184 RepID=UPI000B350F07|nr:LysR family transcriptional regulator [Thaumasiovibrio occultus]
MSNGRDLLTARLPTVKQLQCFLAVAKALNFRKAAEALNMTQPPLTRQIRSLEEQLGYLLFHRNTHQVHLTAQGKQLERQAEDLLRSLQQLTTPMKQSLRIGVTKTLHIENIDALCAPLSEHVDFNADVLQVMASVPLLQSLKKGELDLALVGERADRSDEAIQYHWIYQEPLMLALPSNHSASQNAQVSLTALRDLPLYWFSRSENPAFFDKCEAVFQRLPFALQRQQEPEDSIVMLSKVAKGQGMALLPRSMCRFQCEGLCYRELASPERDTLNVDIYAAMLRGADSAKLAPLLTSLCQPRD